MPQRRKQQSLRDQVLAQQKFIKETHALGNAGKLEEVAARFLEYYREGGRLDAGVVLNGLYPYTAGLPPSDEFVALFPELVRTSLRDVSIYGVPSTPAAVNPGSSWAVCHSSASCS